MRIYSMWPALLVIPGIQRLWIPRQGNSARRACTSPHGGSFRDGCLLHVLWGYAAGEGRGGQLLIFAFLKCSCCRVSDGAPAHSLALWFSSNHWSVMQGSGRVCEYWWLGGKGVRMW